MTSRVMKIDNAEIFYLCLANAQCDRCAMRVKQRVNYASPIRESHNTQHDENMRKRTPGFKHFFFKGCYHANDMNGMMQQYLFSK